MSAPASESPAPQEPQAERPTSFAPPAPAGAFCRACGQGIDPRAVICPGCGVATGHGQALAAPVPGTEKSAGVAVLLSILITCAGHWYTGEVGRGFAFLGAAFLAALSLLFIVGFIALPAICIWAAIDASKSAERHNNRLVAAQQPLALAR